MDLMEKMEFLVHLAQWAHKDYAVNKGYRVKLDCEVLWAQRGRLEVVERVAQLGRLEQVEI
jgi:hypothetical protein